MARVKAGDAEDQWGVAEAEHVEGGLRLGELGPPDNDVNDSDTDDDNNLSFARL